VVRNSLVPGPMHVFGASWGSTLAMEWLVTKRPANVASVIFMCPGLDISRAEESRRRAQQRLSPASSATFDQLARTGKVASEALAAASAEYLRTFIMRRPRPELAYGPPDLAIMKALGTDLASWSRVAELRTLTQPVLFIRGEHDFVTEDDVNVFAAARPGSELVTIPDAGHLAFLDNPDATHDAVRRFLLRIER